MFENIIEIIREFLREVFTKEMLQQLVGYLQKASEYALQVVEYIKDFIEWLYGAILGFFG